MEIFWGLIRSEWLMTFEVILTQKRVINKHLTLIFNHSTHKIFFFLSFSSFQSSERNSTEFYLFFSLKFRKGYFSEKLTTISESSFLRERWKVSANKASFTTEYSWAHCQRMCVCVSLSFSALFTPKIIY